VRKLTRLLPVCALVFNVGLLAALYVPGASYARAVFWLPFIPAFLTFGSALLVVNGGRLGRLDWGRLLAALVAVPRWVQAGLALLFLATAAYLLASRVGPQTELGFERTFVVSAVWITAIGAALHYGARAEAAPSVSRRTYLIALAIFVAVGVALGAASFLLGRDPIYDETATHNRLAAKFGTAVWYPHLVAANTYHGAFIVYLDTLDGTIQDDACTDLKPVAADLGRVPDVYYATGGHGRFVRTC
jgi:hypothetical protein